MSKQKDHNFCTGCGADLLFTSVTGLPYPNSYLHFMIDKAEEDEDYEFCQRIKEELDRRNLNKSQTKQTVT